MTIRHCTICGEELNIPDDWASTPERDERSDVMSLRWPPRSSRFFVCWKHYDKSKHVLYGGVPRATTDSPMRFWTDWMLVCTKDEHESFGHCKFCMGKTHLWHGYCSYDCAQFDHQPSDIWVAEKQEKLRNG